MQLTVLLLVSKLDAGVVQGRDVHVCRLLVAIVVVTFAFDRLVCLLSIALPVSAIIVGVIDYSQLLLLSVIELSSGCLRLELLLSLQIIPVALVLLSGHVDLSSFVALGYVGSIGLALSLGRLIAWLSHRVVNGSHFHPR